MQHRCAHIWQRAAAPLSCEQPAAGHVFGTLMHSAALHKAGIRLNTVGGWDLCVPWDHHFSFDTRGVFLFALVVGGTAVLPVSTAYRLKRSERGSITFIYFILSSLLLSSEVEN